MTEQLTAQELLERSYSEKMEQRRATLLQAIAAADAEQDVEQGYRIRMRYISCCHGAPDVLEMIAAFGWCTARHDEDPERFKLQLWYYKWVMNAARQYTGVSREQLHDLAEDMERRFELAGAASTPVEKERMYRALWLGDLDEAEQRFEKWRTAAKASRVGLNDCSACDLATEAEMLKFLGRNQEALDVAEPLLNQSTGCSTEPQNTFADMLDCTRAADVKEGLELGAELSRKGRDLIRSNSDYVQANGEHLRHLAATGNLQEGLELLRTTAVDARGSDSAVLKYARGARMVLRLAEARGEDDLDDLKRQFDGVAEATAARFDARNGNGYISGWLAQDDQELAAHL